MFFAAEYLARIEEVVLNILENTEPIDKTITLWWGLDGLRLNEDGTTEWVNRRKRNSATQPMRTGYLLNGQMQNAKAQIDALMAQNAMLQMQSWQSA